jgi:DNA-binding response OmpR family regulator
MARILVVDDNPDFVESARFVLEAAGYDVASADNPRDGMVAVERDQPDLIILDVMMDSPDDGFVMARDLRGKGFARPILMLTSISDVSGLSYGPDPEMVPVDAFEEKPIAPGKLLAIVKELLEKGGQP